MKRTLMVCAAVVLAVGITAHADHNESHDQGYVYGDALLFANLDGGTYEVTATNIALLSDTSGAYRVEPVGPTVNVCFPAVTGTVPPGEGIAVWPDTLAWWAMNQSCGLGVVSIGVTGTVTVTHE